MLTRTLAVLTVIAVVSPAMAIDIPLFNAGFEAPDQTNFGVGNALDGWGPNGGYANHPGFAKPNNGTLGTGFGFYTPQGELVLQATGVTIQPGIDYTFASWAQGGGDDIGNVGFVLAYDDGGTPTVFATQDYAVGNAWADLAGVTSAAPAAAYGKELLVGWGPNLSQTTSDIWFDQGRASYIPEPTSIALLGLGGLMMLRRRRH